MTRVTVRRRSGTGTIPKLAHLKHSDPMHLEAYAGWIQLGDYDSANDELEKIRADVLNLRCLIYSSSQTVECASECCHGDCEDDPGSSLELGEQSLLNAMGKRWQHRESQTGAARSCSGKVRRSSLLRLCHQTHHLTPFDGCPYVDWPAAVLAVGHQVKFSIRPVQYNEGV